MSLHRVRKGELRDLAACLEWGMISVLILTRNEEQDLPGCLESVAWSDDVHVFDSFSTDRTAEIARAAGAHVTQRAFDGYASQRNAALRTLPFRHEWLLMLDADERPTLTLVEEMRRAVTEPVPGVNAYRIPIAYFFLDGSRLRHAQTTQLFLRLVRPRMVRYEREINEVLKVEGETGDLKSDIDHFPFSKSLDHWIQKHNVYSTMEAELIASGQFLQSASVKTTLFGRTFHERRVARKARSFIILRRCPSGRTASCRRGRISAARRTNTTRLNFAWFTSRCGWGRTRGFARGPR